MDLLQLADAPFVSGLLLTVGLFGLLLEMQTLHGIAGLVGVVALVLFFVAHIATGGAGIFVAVLAVAGLMLILYELHVVPGHGFPGIVGACVLFASMLLAFGPIGAAAFFVAMQTVASAIIATIVLFYFATRAFPQNAWMQKLTFAGAQGAEYVTSGDYTHLRGRTGMAVSYLRPAGVAQIGDQRVDVLTSGEFIPAGTPVRITRIEGARIFVEPSELPSFKE
ncbi:MAG: NfeD family protein [Candidatus Baltobacteraceae bacterium]